MDCRKAGKLILIEREGALGETGRAALDAHLGACGRCRELQASLVAAARAWKATDARVEVPDIDREWYAIRRRMRTAEAGPRFSVLPAWLIPSLAAAALAVTVFLVGTPWGGADSPRQTNVARAEYVEVADESASTLVYVDEESGWLVVWAVAPPREAGS